MDLINDFKKQIQNVSVQLKEDLKGFRTGRANPSLLEGLIVEAYGGSTKLKLMELATTTTEGPTTLIVVPFDPSTVADIEKAILKSPLGLSPQNQGTRIIIRIPPLSQEQREKYIKLVAQKVEEKKNIVRNQRDEARKKIKNMFEAKEITEDDKYRYEKDIDTATTSLNGDLQSLRENKEKEIMEV